MKSDVLSPLTSGDDLSLSPALLDGLGLGWVLSDERGCVVRLGGRAAPWPRRCRRGSGPPPRRRPGRRAGSPAPRRRRGRSLLDDLARFPVYERLCFIECSGNSYREWRGPGGAALFGARRRQHRDEQDKGGDDQRRGLWLFHVIEPETWARVVARAIAVEGRQITILDPDALRAAAAATAAAA